MSGVQSTMLSVGCGWRRALCPPRRPSCAWSVKMAALLRLAYLAMPVIACACAIVVTRVARHVRAAATASHDWSKGFTRAAVEVEDRRALLHAPPGIKIGSFPDEPSFSKVCSLLYLLRTGIVAYEVSEMRRQMKDITYKCP